MMEKETEVARIRQQIEAEHRASVWALTGLSLGTVQHAFISRRMGHIDINHQRLSQLIGEEKAIEILCEVFDQSPPQKESSFSFQQGELSMKKDRGEREQR